MVTTAPTFKTIDDKKPISVKAPNKLATSSSSARTTKKGIDMGAASAYGKTTDLGINSPTHRNTHNEDLFGSSDISNVSKTNSVIEDIFNDASDDFNPRAGEAPSATTNTDFGDFESAFGNPPQSSISTAKPTATDAVDSDFADFSAFDSSKPVAAAAPAVNDNLLFSAQSTPAATVTQSNSTNNNLLSADLFGNSVLTNAFNTSPQPSSNKDLLSDFGDLTLNPTSQGELIIYSCGRRYH